MKYKKVMLSLPEEVAKKVEHYARLLNDGNKSGFVTKVLEEKIEYLHKAYHTQKMREAYTAAAKESLRISKEWEPLDDELWAKLDKLEAKEKK